MKQTLVIGSRGSQLALTQARFIQGELQRIHPSLETRIEIIKTSGDVNTEPLAVIGGKGVFTKELEDALFDRRIDLAVHSLKDLPTMLPAGVTIAAICKREDPRDALVLPRAQHLVGESVVSLAVVGVGLVATAVAVGVLVGVALPKTPISRR